MTRFFKRENRPTGRSYGAQRQFRSRAASMRTGTFARPQNSAAHRLSPRAFVAALLRRFGPLTPRKAILVGVVALVCIGVPVALVVNAAARSRTAALQGPSAKPLATQSGAPGSTPSAGAAAPSPGNELAGSEESASPSSTPTAEPTPTPPPDPSDTVIRTGMTAPVVTEIQERLMALGYMDEDEPTEYFGPVTSAAVSLFQRQHKLSADGSVGTETYTLLISDEAQKYKLMEGDSGTDVRDLQERLRQLGYLDAVSGKFGEQTTKAVKIFQQYNGLTADGMVGKKSFELLYSSDVKPYFLKYGEQSDKVKTYQKRLNSLGYLISEPDGKYGRDTVAAVKRFQEINGLISDGFLGSNTVQLLMSSKAHVNALVLGMQGKDVENVQKLLKSLGYMSRITGYFGSETEDAAKAFQKRNGLSVDGTVGQQTLSKLSSSGAKKAATGSSGGSSGGTGGKATLKGVDKLISVAQSKLGKPYVWGAKGPNSFDCSGFVYYCLNQSGVKQGYLTSGGWAASNRFQKIKSIDDLKRGDILVFRGSSVGHVGIYLGNGGMIDASSSHGKVVKRSGIWSGTYWKKAFICGFRIY